MAAETKTPDWNPFAEARRESRRWEFHRSLDEEKRRTESPPWTERAIAFDGASQRYIDSVAEDSDGQPITRTIRRIASAKEVRRSWLKAVGLPVSEILDRIVEGQSRATVFARAT
jgi:hypothetical protein